MIHIRTYNELDEFYRAFGTGRLGLMIVKSRGGLGKTQQAKRVLDDACFIAGHTTPLALYQQLYTHKDTPILLDDIDELFENPLNIALLKQVCDTAPIKNVQYNTTGNRRGNIPASFYTKSQVMILCNTLREVHGNLGALMTRAHLINFTPSNREIFNRLKTFAEDDEILNVIEYNLDEAEDFNFRHYERALELKSAGISNWKDFLLEEMLPRNDKVSIMRNLLHECTTDKQRLELWPGSRSDFYNWKAKIDSGAPLQN